MAASSYSASSSISPIQGQGNRIPNFPKPPASELHFLKSRPTRTKPLDHSLITPLKYTPYIEHKCWINTDPLLIVSRRRDLANRPEKLDYYVATPDTYPFLTVLSNYMPDRQEFDRTVRPGTVVKFYGACVYKNWCDVREVGGSRFKAGPIEGGRGHLNIFDKNPHPYYKICTVYDGNGDGEAVAECQRLYRRWLADEEERDERMRRQREEEEERTQLEALEVAERVAREIAERRKTDDRALDKDAERIESMDLDSLPKREGEKKSNFEPADYAAPSWLTGKPLKEKSEEEIKKLKDSGALGKYKDPGGKIEFRYMVMNGPGTKDR